MNRRVVITAESAITPIGRTKDEIVNSLKTGKSGVTNLKGGGFMEEYLQSRVFGTVSYDIQYDFDRKYRKTLSPVSYYACQVAKEVLEKSGLPEEFYGSGRMGVAFGSIHGSPSVQRNIYQEFMDKSKAGKPAVSATDYLKSMVHTTAVNITRMFGITGRVISSCTACTTSSQSIGFGYEAVKFGLQDAMICGGADEYDTTTVGVFDNLVACSVDFNDRPHMTPRPFDKKRDGLVVGEGAGAVLLEDYESAKKRGADIIAEVIGFSCGNNGGDLILPNAEGVRQTILAGLENAGIAPDDVDFISAHATATRMGDIVEAQAIHSVFGDNGPYVTGLKSYMGHTMSACGVIETILTLYMMQDGFIAPTLNLEEVDERCPNIKHVMKQVDEQIKIASIQNFAFGGVNTSLFIKKMD